MQRQQTKWALFGMTVGPLGFLGMVVLVTLFPWLERPGTPATFAVGFGFYASKALIPVGLGIALLRYRLWDIDPIINRTLLYGTLTACVIGLYMGIVVYLSALFRTSGNIAISLVATGVVAVLFQPLRERLQQAINRLMYGERSEPYAVLSRQAGIAVHAVRLTADLQRAREQVVTTREEERRRLRRDRHDGIGPQLASQALTIDAALRWLPRDPAAATQLLTELKAQSQAAITDIRRIAYDLRPPALDDLGLVNALREQAAHYAASDMQITVDAPDSLPALPAAVEVAAYRIVQEALTNVVRHAQARTCVVRLRVDDALHIQVCDDGQGVSGTRRAGIGLTSMRERAAELGGRCVIAAGVHGGTEVTARLPLPDKE